MHELLRRLRAVPRLATELWVASACINLLALADTIYTMILLRRYIAHGFDGTLFLLTGGVLVAVALQWMLTAVRRVLAGGVGVGDDEALAAEVCAALTTARVDALDAMPREDVLRAAADLGEVHASCDANAVCSLLDAPFALLFTISVFFLSPLLAVIVAVGIVLSVAVGWTGAKRTREAAKAFGKAAGESRAVLASSSFAADTVRAFRGASFYRSLFRGAQERLWGLGRVIEDERGMSQALGMGVGVLVRVALYAVGAKLAVEGELTVAGLIGASILGSYALARASGCVQVGQLMLRAAESHERLDALRGLPAESAGRSGHAEYAGGLEVRDVGFSFGGPPLFSGLTFTLPPGGVLVVRGHNGSGKTTLLRLLAGLVAPEQGAIRVGGADLAGLAPEWWRSQIAWLPQEPFFLAGTVRRNIELAAPGLDSAGLRSVVRRARLEHFLDTSEKGVETPVVDAGRTWPVGIRKRMALARVLASSGRLALFDEPTAGMDEEGTQAVYEALNALVREGRTLVVVSADPNIIKGATMVLDLSARPVTVVGVPQSPQGGTQ